MLHVRQLHCGDAKGVVARCGPFPMFPGILPGEEAHCKPLWRVFPNGCGWSPGDTWCFFLPCRGIFVTFWWVFAVFMVSLMPSMRPSVPISATILSITCMFTKQPHIEPRGVVPSCLAQTR